MVHRSGDEAKDAPRLIRMPAIRTSCQQGSGLFASNGNNNNSKPSYIGHVGIKTGVFSSSSGNNNKSSSSSSSTNNDGEPSIVCDIPPMISYSQLNSAKLIEERRLKRLRDIEQMEKVMMRTTGAVQIQQTRTTDTISCSQMPKLRNISQIRESVSKLQAPQIYVNKPVVSQNLNQLQAQNKIPTSTLLANLKDLESLRKRNNFGLSSKIPSNKSDNGGPGSSSSSISSSGRSGAGKSTNLAVRVSVSCLSIRKS